jgi:hypothetical protein
MRARRGGRQPCHWEKSLVRKDHDRPAAKAMRIEMVRAFLEGDLELYVRLDKAHREIIGRKA